MLFNAARIVCGLLTRRRGILYLLMSQLILLKNVSIALESEQTWLVDYVRCKALYGANMCLLTSSSVDWTLSASVNVAVSRPSVCPIARHSNGGWRVALQLSTLWQEIPIDRLAAGAVLQASELSSKANSVMLRPDEGGLTQIPASVGSELLWSACLCSSVCRQAHLLN